MSDEENFLHTTHRTVSWFKKAHEAGDLMMSPPFQRNLVWTVKQKSYLIDTILNGFPVPELYMQDKGDSSGNETYIVVDGQQRISSVLGFMLGDFSLEGEDVARIWRRLPFANLTDDLKKKFFTYKFVVRILPPTLADDDIRKIFARLNKNVVSLTDQELRNAVYSGPFIQSVQKIADNDLIWSESGLFTANDVRRMNDHEFISELIIAYLHGPQNKKDKLDHFYQIHEVDFEDASRIEEEFQKVGNEIMRIIPNIKSTRWRKKSDFYTIFLELIERHDQIPFSSDRADQISEKIERFSEAVDAALRLEGGELDNLDDEYVKSYARSVSRAASDRANRIARARALSLFVFDEVSRHAPSPHSEL